MCVWVRETSLCRREKREKRSSHKTHKKGGDNRIFFQGGRCAGYLGLIFFSKSSLFSLLFVFVLFVCWHEKRFSYFLRQTPITRKTTHRLLPKRRNNLSRKKASNCLNPSPRRRLLRCLSPPRLRKPSRARTSPSLTSLWRTWTFWASSPSRCSLLSRCPFWSSCTWNPRRKATFPVVSRNRTTTNRRDRVRSWRTKPPRLKALAWAWDQTSKRVFLLQKSILIKRRIFSRRSRENERKKNICSFTRKRVKERRNWLFRRQMDGRGEPSSSVV